MSGPRLRAGLVIEQRGVGASLTDPLTGRAFAFDESQAAVLAVLDGQRSVEQLAEDVFGDPSAVAEVTELVDGLRRLHLLGHIVDPDKIGHAQAMELRSRAAARRDHRVADSVRWAASEIPLYQKRLAGRAAMVRGVADLAALPTTSKQDVRDNFPHGLIARGYAFAELLERGEIHMVTSSGSTGDRLESFTTLSQREPYALYCLHPAMRGAGDPETLRIAFFTTPICSSAVCHLRAPYEERVIDEGRQLVLPSSERVMRLRRPEIEQIIDELQRFAPAVLQLDPVYGVAFVRAAQRAGLAIPKVKAIFSTYEYMTRFQQEILSDAFGIPIFQLYGASEINGVASFTCENGRFHALEESHVFEFLRDQQPVGAGELGEATVTMVRGPYSRLIRYRLGDLGRPVAECGCQFDDVTAFEIEGRVQDVVFTTRGEPVTTRQVDALFEGLRWLDFYQFSQRDSTGFELLAVPRAGSDAGTDEKVFTDRVRERFGPDAELRIGYVRELPINPSYKYPPTLNRSGRRWRPNG